mmetsp:Transcript_3674/g.9301  ORF Transcript_3674/g.9301 Transcript_3674/m.9301 type:complete len:311 (+) Transcript_3674:2-934(+)
MPPPPAPPPPPLMPMFPPNSMPKSPPSPPPPLLPFFKMVCEPDDPEEHCGRYTCTPASPCRLRYSDPNMPHPGGEGSVGLQCVVYAISDSGVHHLTPEPCDWLAHSDYENIGYDAERKFGAWAMDTNGRFKPVDPKVHQFVANTQCLGMAFSLEECDAADSLPYHPVHPYYDQRFFCFSGVDHTDHNSICVSLHDTRHGMSNAFSPEPDTPLVFSSIVDTTGLAARAEAEAGARVERVHTRSVFLEGPRHERSSVVVAVVLVVGAGLVAAAAGLAAFRAASRRAAAAGVEVEAQAGAGLNSPSAKATALL